MPIPLTPLSAGIMLAVIAVLLFLFVRKDRQGLEAFKRLTATEDRRRVFRLWLVQSFLGYGGTGLLVLAVTGRLRTLTEMPAGFAPLAATLRGHAAVLLTGVAAGVLALIVLVVLVQGRARKRQQGTSETPKARPDGEVPALLPRNFGERLWVAALCINAGFSEELMFRLVVPLLLSVVTGDAAISFLIATAAFGILHAYQGLAGMIASTVIGGILAVVYLTSGALWIVMVIHAFIDLMGLVILPALRTPRRGGRP